MSQTNYLDRYHRNYERSILDELSAKEPKVEEKIVRTFSEIHCAVSNKLFTLEKFNEELYFMICEKDFGVSKDMIIGKSRKRHIVILRQLFCYLTKKANGHILSLKEIGKKVGGLDHATVIHACSVIQNFVDTNDMYFFEVKHIFAKKMNVEIFFNKNQKSK